MRTYEGSLWEFFVDELKRYDWHLGYLIGTVAAIAIVAAVVPWVIFLIPVFLMVAPIRCLYRAVFRMKESAIWFSLAYVLAIAAAVSIVIRYYLPSDPMYVEMLATLFGVLIAISLSEGIRNGVEEKRAKLVQDELIGELRDIQNKSSQDPFTERYSPTWTAIKAKGIPDRIESKLRKALSEAFVLFEDHNNKLRRYDDLRLTGDPEDKRLSELFTHVRMSSEKFVESAQRVLEMVDS